MSDASNSGHPLAFKNGSTAYTTGVTTTGTAGTSGASVVIAVDAAAPATGLLYYCTVHGNAMGNTITTSANTTAIDYSTETITATAHGFSNGDEVTYTVPTGQSAIGGLTTGTNYFVVSATTDTLKLAATSGGAAINLTAPLSVTVDGSNGSAVVLEIGRAHV